MTSSASSAEVNDSADANESSGVNGWSAYPGVKPPERTRTVDSGGIAISVVEWGEASGPVLMLAHGGADFARTFDGFAPLLASAGYRVVSWDHRSHGDSEGAALLSWEADCRDAVAILNSSMEDRPPGEKAYAVGHSKGGGLMTHLCVAMPERFHCLVNIDGVPALRSRPPSKTPVPERVKKRDQWVSGFLDHRQKAHQAVRRPGSAQDLVKRRARLNPRLSAEWLRYLATVGARQDSDGWRWKLDPLVRMGGIGPWQPEWSAAVITAVTLPTLAILGREAEAMGWGTTPEEAAKTLPAHSELEVYEDSGHFVHIEHPERTAHRVLEFLAQFPSPENPSSKTNVRLPATPSTPPTHNECAQDEPVSARGATNTVRLRHGRLELCLHQLATGADEQAPVLLCLHELGGNSKQFETGPITDWPGDVWALDLSGHGASDWAPGGGYAPEWSLGDVDAALTHLNATKGPVSLLGRGFGAYIALLTMGARPRLVHSATLCSGAGLVGGGSAPGPPSSISAATPYTGRNTRAPSSAADPLAIAEFSIDIRPPEYTKTFARQIAHLHPGSDKSKNGAAGASQSTPLPIWISTPPSEQPPWLKAIAPQCHQATSEAHALHKMRSAASQATPRNETT